MRKLLTSSVIALALGMTIVFGASEVYAYCAETAEPCTKADGSSGTITRCCGEAAPPSPDDPPPDPAGGLVLCGQVDNLIGGCVQVGGNPPGPLFAAGCVDGIGVTSLDPMNPPEPGVPDTNCANHAVEACAICGCATETCE